MRKRLSGLLFVCLPVAAFAQNAVTVASGGTYTYSTTTAGQVASIANDDGSQVVYHYDANGDEIGISVPFGRNTSLSVRYVGGIVYAPGLPAIIVYSDGNGRTSEVTVHPDTIINESGGIELDASNWWESPSTAASFSYDTNGYLAQATLNGGLALQLAAPNAGVVHQTLFGSAGNILAQSNAVGSTGGVRVIPAQLDAVAAEFGLGSQWADTLSFQSSADGHLTTAFDANGQPVLYLLNAGAYRVGFSPDGTPLFYDIEPNYASDEIGRASCR